MTIKDLDDGTFLAMHGNGAYYGNIVTNSREAFEKWYRKGIRIFEMDIAETSDSEYVAISHFLDREDLITRQVFNTLKNSNGYSREWFLSLKLYRYTSPGLTPLSLSEITHIMRMYKDVIFIIDTFGLFTYRDTERLKRKIGELVDEGLENRLLVEVYNDDMYRGFGGEFSRLKMVYCMKYRYQGCDIEADKTVDELKDMNISFLSYPYKYIKGIQDVKEYVDDGMNILCYSEDNSHYKELNKIGIRINLVDNIYSGYFIYLKRSAFMVQNYLYRAAVGIIRRLNRVV